MTAEADLRDYSDEALVAAFREKGNRSALGILYQRYAHLVLGLCLDYLKNREDAKDAVMDVFEKTTRKLGGHKVKAFKPWLYYVTRNHCLDLLRQRVEAAPREFFEEFFVESTPNSSLINEQRLEWLSEAMARLKAHQRECLELFYFREQSYEAVSQQTGYTEKEVKSYLQNGRRNLKIILTRMEHERAE